MSAEMLITDAPSDLPGYCLQARLIFADAGSPKALGAEWLEHLSECETCTLANEATIEAMQA